MTTEISFIVPNKIYMSITLATEQLGVTMWLSDKMRYVIQDEIERQQRLNAPIIYVRFETSKTVFTTRE